jgi:hypothetical protein
MSTKSTISIQTEKGIKSIYCHFDGYPSHHMPILTEHYNTQEKVEALTELGDLSVLAESIECPKGHSFDNKIEGYCVAYGRDRGEEGTQYCNFLHKSEIQKQEYNYLFINNEWVVFE